MSVFRIAEPEKVVFALEIRMTLKDWRRLRDQLKPDTRYPDWPAADLVEQIDNMVAQASKEFYPQE